MGHGVELTEGKPKEPEVFDCSKLGEEIPAAGVVKAPEPSFKKRKAARKKKHRKEIMRMYDKFKAENPDAVKEEVVFQGIYITVARVTIEWNGMVITGEGEARRSGLGCVLDEEDFQLANDISIGRARVPAAFRLAARKPWVKMRSGRNYLLMA